MEDHLGWALGAIAIPLTINLGTRTFTPGVEDLSVPGLTVAQTHDVLSRITHCWPKRNNLRDTHACVVTEDPRRWIRGPHGEAAVIARGI